MGKILKPKGLKGNLWIVLYNKVNTSLDVGKKVWINSSSDSLCELLIESLTVSGKKSWIKFFDYDNRDLSSTLTGLEFLNSKFEPFDLKLDGWSEAINENIE